MRGGIGCRGGCLRPDAAAGETGVEPLRLVSLLTAARADKSPRIDGEFEDACWRKAPVVDEFFDFLAKSPKPATVRTECRMAYDDRHVYFAVHCREQTPGKISAEHKADEMWRDDSIELYLTPGGADPATYHKFAVNAAGANLHERRARDVRQKGGADSWGLLPAEEETEDSWRVETVRDDTGWRAEIAIPRHLFDAGNVDLWRFALVRFSYTDGKRFATSAPGARFNNPAAFGYAFCGRIERSSNESKVGLADGIDGHWTAPLHEGYLLKDAEGIRRVASAEKVLTARRQAVAGALQEVRDKLSEEHPLLAKAGEDLARRLEKVTLDGGGGPVELSRALATVNEVLRKMKTLDPDVVIEGPRKDARKGVDVFRVKSPYLGGGAHKVEVLLPDAYDEDKAYRVLYALPVEPGIGGQFGDALAEIRKASLHNEHGLICVSMAFDSAPWFGSHANDPAIRHDAYIKDVVLPLIEKRYAVKSGPESRLLLGFSKSGWGAFSLLLRNPDVFGYACSWDAPMIMDGDDFNLWGVDKHFGAKETFIAHSPMTAAVESADELRDQPPRLVLLGHNFFGNRFACPKDSPHTRTYHQHLEKLDIPHVYNNELPAGHSWNRKWLVPALKTLMNTVTANP